MATAHTPQHWQQVIESMIARNTDSAPTVPGIYRMPCGECYVDFFVDGDGTEHWLVPGDPTGYTRASVAVARHGNSAWERMYTLAEAANQIRQRAAATGGNLAAILDELARPVDENRADDAEIARLVQERRDMDEVPLADVARKFGIDLHDDEH